MPGLKGNHGGGKEKARKVSLCALFVKDIGALLLDADHQRLLGTFFALVAFFTLVTTAAAATRRAGTGESRNGDERDTRQTEKELFHIGAKHPPSPRDVKCEDVGAASASGRKTVDMPLPALA